MAVDAAQQFAPVAGITTQVVELRFADNFLSEVLGQWAVVRRQHPTRRDLFAVVGISQKG
jgi:hypothetical protein